ncbi:DUF3108 domain-containing protein [Haliangium ochraceum]|uniref:DUF3108 domain-containing protein n=1 Tax=Haliangium ochraceum TaxID=80816 RepID=UPI0018EF9507|nr:DUF3108 domain-containing protein [Haliangium ochraceum]
MSAGIAALLGACGGSAPATPRASEPSVKAASSTSERLVSMAGLKPYFVAGETFSFELSFQGILTGRAGIAVGEPGQVEGREVLIVRSAFETAGAVKFLKNMRDNIDTQIDWLSGAPITHSAHAENDESTASAQTRFEGDTTVIVYERSDKPTLTIQVVLPEGETMYELHSLLGMLRAWEPDAGDRVVFYSVSGRRVWRTEMHFAGSETMRTPMGLYAALHFEGVSRRLKPDTLAVDENKDPRRIGLWISDDIKRMPLRFIAYTEYGEFQADLVDYRQPEAQLSRSPLLSQRNSLAATLRAR